MKIYNNFAVFGKCKPKGKLGFKRIFKVLNQKSNHNQKFLHGLRKIFTNQKFFSFGKSE